MSAHVSYIDINHLPTGLTLESSLELVLDAFQNEGVAGEHTSVPNKGGFFGGNAFNGTDYGYVSKTVAHYAFVASGELHYFFPPYSGHVGDGPTAHTVWGSLDSITLGGGYPTTTPKGIVGAKIPNGPLICSPGGGTVGQPPCGLPTTYGFTTLNGSCAPVGNTKAIWVPATNCQSTAQLIFQP